MNSGPITKTTNSFQNILTLAVWFGVFSGLLEGVLYWILIENRWLSMKESVLGVGPDQIWVSAGFNLLVFGALGTLFAILTTLWPRHVLGSVAVAVFSYLAAFDLLALSGRLQLRGPVVLAAGVAVQCVRWYRRDPAARMAFFRRTLPGICVIAGVLFCAVRGGAWGVERYQQWRQPASRQGAPNVLLVVIDTLRADHLSGYGYGRKTSPRLDLLANEGALFQRAYSGSSWTLPSHATLFTGRFVSEHLADGRATGRMLDNKFPTLAETFAALGYRTGGFSANTPWNPPWTGLARGFQHYECLYRDTTDMTARTFFGRLGRKYLGRMGFQFEHPRRPSPAIIADFLAWLGKGQEQPFFAFLNLMDVHEPYYAEPGYSGRFQGELPSPVGVDPVRDWNLSPREAAARRELIGEYDNAISFVDAQVGKLMDELRQRGQLENTLLVITSDHGELFGEHGLFDHGSGVHYPLIHVPLIMRWAGRIAPGTLVSEPVSQRNLAATLVDLTNPENRVRISSDSFQSLLSGTGEPSKNRTCLSEVDKADIPALPKNWPARSGWLKTVVNQEWQFILHENGKGELFNLQDDTEQIRDQSGTPRGREICEKMKQAIVDFVPGLKIALYPDGNPGRRETPQPNLADAFAKRAANKP